jgi:hypothetical protein
MNEVQTPLTMEPRIKVEPPTEILLFSPYRRNSNTFKPYSNQHKPAQPKFHPYQPKYFPNENVSEFKTHPILPETYYSGNTKLQETFYPKVQSVLFKNTHAPQITTQNPPKTKVEKFQIGHWSGKLFSFLIF